MAMFRTYTETYDMNTEVGYPTVMSIHSPIGKTPYRMLEPCFRMYKKYKYLGADITVVNSARLPADPEQIGKVSGTNYVSPKDMLDPILFKGCHGESLGNVLDAMYNGQLSNNLFFNSPTIDRQAWALAFENFYYTALGDDSWRKSPIQKTLSIKNLHPLVYSLSANHQILPTNGLSAVNYSENNTEAISPVIGTGDTAGCENGSFRKDTPAGWSYPLVTSTFVGDNTGNPSGSYRAGMLSMFTSKMHRLGWLDTFQFIGQNTNTPAVSGEQYKTPDTKIAELPKIQMGILMLPPAHLCRQYLRVIIRHKFKFAQYRSITEGASSSWNGDTIGYFDKFTGNVPESKGDYDPSALDIESGPREDPEFEKMESDDLDD